MSVFNVTRKQANTASLMILDEPPLQFRDLVERFGDRNAASILSALEAYEGIITSHTKNIDPEERLGNVLLMMTENAQSHTTH